MTSDITVSITPAEVGYLATASCTYRDKPVIVMAGSITGRGAQVRAINALGRELARRRAAYDEAWALAQLEHHTVPLRPAGPRGDTERTGEP